MKMQYPRQRGPQTVAWSLAALLTVGAVTLTGCGGKPAAGGKGGKRGAAAGGPIPVQVASVSTGTIASSVPVVGNMNALQDVQVASRVTARVTQVYVREGDQVHKGQILVQQDTTDLQANVRQDEASIQNAQAQVTQAVANYQNQVQTAKQNILNAQAALNAAQQNYAKYRGGNRPEQIQQAQAQALQAKLNSDNALVTLNRDKALFAQGALAKADLDTAQNTYDVNVQIYQNAQAALRLSQAGYQSEDIAAALAQVREQQANLRNQQANEKQVEVRKGEIQAAQATVRQARNKLAYDQQQVNYAAIVSPIDGIVAAREVEPGQVASASTQVVRVVNVRTMYYEPTISETDLGQVNVGNPVSVVVDALPGKKYGGKVTAIYPAASTDTRVYSLRVTVDDPQYNLRPGMYARGGIQTQVHRNVVIVPVNVLVPTQSGLQATADQGSVGEASGQTTLPPQQVYLVGSDNKAVAQPVKLGIVTSNQAEVVSGLKPGQSLVTDGQGLLQPGSAVQVVNRPRGGAGRSMTAEATPTP